MGKVRAGKEEYFVNTYIDKNRNYIGGIFSTLESSEMYGKQAEQFPDIVQWTGTIHITFSTNNTPIMSWFKRGNNV